MPAFTVHEMRRKVTAIDKMLAVQKPFAEAVKHIQERYSTDADSSQNYVQYLRGLKTPDGVPRKTNPVDKRHTRFDETRGVWVQVPDDEDGD